MRAIISVLGAALFWATCVALAWAHEVRPAIGDMTVAGGILTLDITLNAEAIVAGVDLEGVADTNETAQAEQVDALRALEPDAFAERLRADAAQIAGAVVVTADGSPVPLEMGGIAVGPVGNVDLPRDTLVTLTGAVPEGAHSLQVRWPAEYGALILRQQGVEEPYTGYLDNGTPSDEIALGGGGQDTAAEAFLSYVPVGFDHILPKGLDHILFVLGLFFLSTHIRPLLWQVSAFTLAHTVTLALGAMGWVTVPASIVEPLIAASIVFVAVENILSDGLSRWRPIVVFVFGLLHGLGFASVLGEFGLPQDQFIPALIGFNVGVELGQLTVIALAFLLVWMALRVDENEVPEHTGQAFYTVLALAFVALGWLLDGPGFVSVMGAPAPVFLWPLAMVSLFCVLSATHVDRLEAYRTYVAIPVSVGIALVGFYWFVERVFL
ncbi:HupE/UreJ family protein [Puniceibacterium sediminis]|uniref:HupE / UreJ protein n=1 Tax=Puniceibacterium sediminis TaxID=1608407 RepID=A0A238W1D0_9RHOB|nr:HupE/UreJ family protein [Puniceibacterium sediminis]SNR40164.1 HupE / UreJ protein [Puniceibacterium sediminis]